MPPAQTALAHSLLLLQLAPSGRFEPAAQAPFMQTPLPHWGLLAQELPGGAPFPLPTQAPFVQTPLAQSVPAWHVPPPGAPAEQIPARHSPLAQSALFVQLLPPGRLAPLAALSPEDPQAPASAAPTSTHTATVRTANLLEKDFVIAFSLAPKSALLWGL